MKKNRITFPFFSLLVLSLAVVMISFMGFFIYRMSAAEKAEITISTWDAQKEYDGTPLTNHSWEILSGRLKKGHELEVVVTGSQTEVGSSMNEFTYVIWDELGNDVTDLYEVNALFGVLTVFEPEEQTITDNSDPISPDDGPSGGSGGSGNNESLILVYTDRSDRVYLRRKSYGNYTGTEWNERVPSYGNKDALNPLQYLSIALERQSYTLENMKIKTETGLTYTPYHFNGDYDLCDADDRLLPYSGGQYKVNYYYQYDVSILKNLTLKGTKYEYEEKQYSKYVYNNYLSVTENEKATLLLLAEQAGIKADDPDVIERVADYIRHAAVYNLDYKPYPDNTNHALYFLLTAKEGVCVQYASSATLMYRALGIPARYVTGYSAETVAGKWTAIDAAIGHAWVEVYIDGLGWIPVEVTGSVSSDESGGDYEAPDATENSERLVLKPVYVSKKYTGEIVKAVNEVTGFEKWEEVGFRYEVSIRGSQRDYGYGVSTIDSIKIFDPSGVEVTSQFEIERQTGEIHVYYSKLTSSSRDLVKQYDAKTPDLSYIKHTGSLMSGHRIVTESTASKNVGEFANSYSVVVLDSKGNDVSYYYEIVRNYGDLVITPCSITLKAGDGEKVYDGTALTCNSYTITSGALISGQSISKVNIEGSQVEIGRSDNLITEIIITDKDGDDVTGNYAIILVAGHLKVTVR